MYYNVTDISNKLQISIVIICQINNELGVDHLILKKGEGLTNLEPIEPKYLFTIFCGSENLMSTTEVQDYLFAKIDLFKI